MIGSPNHFKDVDDNDDDDDDDDDTDNKWTSSPQVKHSGYTY